jgi:hypothetical protein
LTIEKTKPGLTGRGIAIIEVAGHALLYFRRRNILQFNTRNAFVPVVAAALVAASAGANAAEQVWRVQNGTVTMSLFRQVIRGCQLDLVNLRQTAAPRGDMEEAVGFAISKSTDLEFVALGGRYRNWKDGGVSVSGGFGLKSANGSLSVQDFTVAFRETGTNDNLFIASSDGNVYLDLSHIKVLFDRSEQTILVGYADVIINDRGAKKLGRPDLAGQVIGMATVGGRSKFVSGDPRDPIPPANGEDGGGGVNGDVMLFNLSDCASYGRVGTYPNGTSGLGVGTTSCNVSNTPGDNINWFAQMDERHPTIAQNFYRIREVEGAGTRLEQIGVGWVKHGFLSTNSNGCGQCVDPPLGGNQLGIHCSDTYGSSLNASRAWLGPRNEVNAFTGRWECTGSYFSGYQNDCVERFTTGGLSPVDHRLQVRDQDLLVADSQFFYEAYYVSENDVDRYNNVAYRPCSPAWSAGQAKWNFPPTASQTQGVLVDHWGQIQPAPRAMPNSEGDILVAVEVTDLGSGNYHYEYAVYNHNSNREARTFSVPLPAGANVTNIQFRDIDTDAGNDWDHVIENGAITWSTETYAANEDANSLKWYSLYNFRFDANVPPADGQVGMALFRPGTVQTVAALSRVPRSGSVNPTSMNVGPGTILSGNLTDLLFSDDSRLQLRPTAVFSSQTPPIRVQLDGTSPVASPSSMSFRLESQATSVSLGKTVEAFNFTTGQWVVVHTSASTTSDSTVNINIPNPGQYVQVGSRTVRIRVNFKPTGPILSNPYTARMDQAIWVIQ